MGESWVSRFLIGIGIRIRANSSGACLQGGGKPPYRFLKSRLVHGLLDGREAIPPATLSIRIEASIERLGEGNRGCPGCWLVVAVVGWFLSVVPVLVRSLRGSYCVDPAVAIRHDAIRPSCSRRIREDAMPTPFALIFASGLLFANSGEASTATHLDVQLADSPALARASSEGFSTVLLDASGNLGTYQVGIVADGAGRSGSGLSRIEWSSGALRSTPSIAVPLAWVHAVASSSYPQSRVVLAGVADTNFTGLMRVVAFCQDERVPCLDREIAAQDGVKAIAVAGVGDRGSFDLLVGGTSTIRLESPSGTATWQVATGRVSALAYLPSAGAYPARVASVGASLQIRSAQSGMLEREFPLFAESIGPYMIAGKTAGSEENKLFVWSRLGGISAYGTEPARLLWSKPNQDVAAATLVRRDASVAQDLFILDTQGRLRLLDGSGTPIGTGISEPSATYVTSVSTGTTTRVLVASSQGGRVVAARRSSIGTIDTVWMRYSGHFNRFAISDIAGDNQPRIVSLAEGPLLSSSPLETWLRIADAESGAEEWASRFPPDAPAGGSDKIIEMTVGKNVGNEASTIYLVGSLVSPGIQYIIEVDGVTRAMRSRRPITFGGDRFASKALPFTKEGRAKLAIVSAKGLVGSSERARLHVVDVGTLAIEWSSAILGDGDIASFVVDQPSVEEAAVAYFSNPSTGVYAFNLFSGAMLYSVYAHSGAIALKRDQAGTRLVYAEIGRRLVSIDALTGVMLDARPLDGEVHAMSQDPTDSNRLVIARDGGFCSYDFAAGRCEGHSAPIGRWALLTYGSTGRLVAHLRNGVPEFIAGNQHGIWRARLADDTLFESGFDAEAAP